jgi:hypothetical protein
MSVVPVTRGPGGRPAAVLKQMKREVRRHDAHDWARYRDAIRQQEHGAPRDKDGAMGESMVRKSLKRHYLSSATFPKRRFVGKVSP